MIDLAKEIITDVCYIGVTTIAGIATYYGKKFIDSKQGLIDKQQEALKQQIGDAQYQKDVDIAKRTVLAIEQEGKEFNWEGALKHSKATEIISRKTGLSSGDIYDIIKSVVSEINLDKKSLTQNTAAPNSAQK
ncbi:hypothetical protein AB8U03_13645 [Clostridium sp. Mt-5]|uniref:Phage holin, LL-H family n=1 Tax=Clostridium moutaii TaxID=3240932 RepID=A0ABV4BR12_9CLOT